MLKLEKASKDRDIYIRMRSKERFCDSLFKQALLIALSLHLFAGLIFHISPFKLFNERVLPPIMVEADLSGIIEESEGGISTQLETEEMHSYPLAIPTSSMPVVPPLPKLVLLNELKIFDKTILASNPFLEIEKDYRPISFKTTSTYQPPIQIIVSGMLAEKKSPHLAYPLTIDIPMSQKLSFYVQVENRTGKVFWFSPKDKGVLGLQKLAENLLKEIEFPKETNDFVTTGEIEVVFHSFSNAELL